ncbi:Hydroperoxy fatty acid reductase gpx1 [Rhodovastum atsumiense]|uniref:Glutathione peroxidase n=1 Tax=Rhodovastum atsumiense TaxID=504468 RepID=A0A5M6IRU9_9PROT|nr:glutathione peroxidase [Rhodovastum atsumiense]KAA5610298.1 glutathione peroxidase [Rhodovastum atsumiense]CAH2602214.1 Hydroperoxy fatty acid reductase gpx1 [Rhodovastum atsumiense]
MDIYDISTRRNDGATQSLGDYRGQVLLIVNTASRCGFTPQYAGLQALQDRFAARGFSVLAFPCNQFAGQEPGDDAQIRGFCETTYHTTFPLFAKVDVNGAGQHPLFAHLKAQKGGLLGSAIKWNFTKFLVGRDGRVLERFPPTTSPEAIAPRIEAALAAPVPQPAPAA